MFVETVAGSCFINSIDGFHHSRATPDEYQTQSMADGGGWTISGYINTQACKKNYQYMVQHYPILYQSPIRKRKDTHQEVFFVVFDTSRHY